MFTHHLSDAKTVPKIMKWNLVIIFVYFVKEIPENGQSNVKFRDQTQLEEHVLDEEEDFLVVVL